MHRVYGQRVLRAGRDASQESHLRRSDKAIMELSLRVLEAHPSLSEFHRCFERTRFFSPRSWECILFASLAN